MADTKNCYFFNHCNVSLALPLILREGFLRHMTVAVSQVTGTIPHFLTPSDSPDTSPSLKFFTGELATSQYAQSGF
jgi:hypothetical protein